MKTETDLVQLRESIDALTECVNRLVDQVRLAGIRSPSALRECRLEKEIFLDRLKHDHPIEEALGPSG